MPHRHEDGDAAPGAGDDLGRRVQVVRQAHRAGLAGLEGDRREGVRRAWVGLDDELGLGPQHGQRVPPPRVGEV
jgi:hypothetical protein